MDTQAKLSALLDLVEQIGIGVRLLSAGAGGEDHAGGALATVRGREVLFLDAQASLADQLAVAAAALAGRAELDDMYIVPELRDVIEANAPSDGKA